MRTHLKIVLAILIVTGLSCNLFEPKEPNPDKWYMTGEAWVIEGMKKMWKEKWEGAISDFNRALSLNSSLSEAYFYKGKCILRLHNVDLHQVWDDINPENQSDNVPFLYNPAGINLFQVIPRFNIELYDYDAGKFLPYYTDTLIDSVFLERKRIYDAICQAIKLLDTIHYEIKKMDHVIQRAQYESDYLIEISVKTILSIPDINNNSKLDFDSINALNDTIISEEKRAFRILCQDIPSLDNMEFDSLKTISKDPRDIKKNLDLILQSLNQADSSYDLFKDDLSNGDMDTTMAEDLGDMIENFKKILPFFYYDDFKDNDHDYWNTNQNSFVDRMIWIDWDFDKMIDVDQAGTMHIGDSTHIKANPSYYEVVDPTDDDFKRYRYKGPYTYEFIGGDWGVDEEILDGEDNDGDSLIDEDTRISADTLDDDGDWVNTDTSGGPDTTAIWPNSYHPMDWVGGGNFTLDITGPSSDWDSVPVDPEYGFIHNNPDILADSLIHYPIYNYPGYPGYPDNFAWPDLIPRYINKLYTAEFLGGDYGIDEEWYDGLDNDKDGLYDEDVGELLPPESLRDELITQLEQLGLRN